MVLSEYVSLSIKPLPHKPNSSVKLMFEISTDPVSFPGKSRGPIRSVKLMMLSSFNY